jgi:hypothetical protein
MVTILGHQIRYLYQVILLPRLCWISERTTLSYLSSTSCISLHLFVKDGIPKDLTDIHATRMRPPHRIAALIRCRNCEFRCGRSRFNPQLHAKLPTLHCKEQCYRGGSDIRLDYFIHAIRYTSSPITNVTCYQRQPRRSLLLGLGQRTRSGRRTCLPSRNMSAALCRIVLCRNTKCCTHPAYIANMHEHTFVEYCIDIATSK